VAYSRGVIAIVGPTGVGKSGLAISLVGRLAEHGVTAEIINADAMQLYRGLDIGTAKVSADERESVVHHLLDVWSPEKEASVADYQSQARDTITDCFQRGVVPIMVGGSGLYVSSVLYEFDFPGTQPAVRATLEQRLQVEGVEALAAELAERDPDAADAIDPRNSRRIVRALEVIHITGKPFRVGLHARSTLWVDRVKVVGLTRDRVELKAIIEQRVADMWASGLVDEVRGLVDSGTVLGVTAAQAIGYRQALSFLEGSMTEDEAIAETVMLTRRYARRQMSWFRRDPHITWTDMGDSTSQASVIDECVAWVGGGSTGAGN